MNFMSMNPARDLLEIINVWRANEARVPVISRAGDEPSGLLATHREATLRLHEIEMECRRITPPTVGKPVLEKHLDGWTCLVLAYPHAWNNTSTPDSNNITAPRVDALELFAGTLDSHPRPCVATAGLGELLDEVMAYFAANGATGSVAAFAIALVEKIREAGEPNNISDDMHLQTLISDLQGQLTRLCAIEQDADRRNKVGQLMLKFFTHLPAAVATDGISGLMLDGGSALIQSISS